MCTLTQVSWGRAQEEKRVDRQEETRLWKILQGLDFIPMETTEWFKEQEGHELIYILENPSENLYT